MCVRCGTGAIAWCTDPMRHGEPAESVRPGEPPVTSALSSCEHVECMKVLNVAALLTAADGPEIESVGRFVDVSASVASLKPFSLDCDVHLAVVYFRDASTGDWFMLPVSRVTDPRLLAQLESAART